MDAKLHKKLSERQEKGTLRSLSSFEGAVDFYSNDYLGWAQEKQTFEGVSGATGSRLISGNSELCERVEAEFATFFGNSAALMFNSGYDANLGIFSSIPQKGDIVLYDEHIHASARDGLRLSLATSYSFRHNDPKHLRERLDSFNGQTVYVAVESLYSMNGDFAPLKEIFELTEKYGAYLIVDEAHSGGVFGPWGTGCVRELGIAPFINLITFGKAYGSHGACVLCSTETKQYLINFARSFIYTTALPPFVFRHNSRVITDQSNETRREQLKTNIAYFRKLALGLTLVSDEASPIQIIRVGSVDKTKELAAALQKSGIAVKPIFSPTVPPGEECLRICIHSFNSSAEIDSLVRVIINLPDHNFEN